MSSEILSQLLNTIATVDDLKLLRNEIAELKKSVYQNGKNSVEKVLSLKVRASVATLLSPGLDTQPEQLLTAIETELAKLPILRMRLAFSPTQATIDKIATWLRKNSEQHWVLDLQIDPEILAGTIIEVDGFYRDFSYREKIGESIRHATQKLISTAL